MSTIPTAPSVMSETLFEAFARLIYARSGIRITPQKRAMLSNRLRRRLRAAGAADFNAYYRHLRALPPRDAEWDRLLQEVSTHETYLFRDKEHWRWLQQEFLPQASEAARRGKRPRRLRFWSAACSTGDEAYSAAICVTERLTDLPLWRVEILGTDLGADAVAQAQHGEFGQRAMRLVTRDLRRRYFEEDRVGDIWRARPVLRRIVTFRRHNLMNPLRSRTFDVVFLKNVLIYFDARSKQVVLDYVTRTLPGGGYLVCGAAEGIAQTVSGFERIQPWLYRKHVG